MQKKKACSASTHAAIVCATSSSNPALTLRCQSNIKSHKKKWESARAGWREKGAYPANLHVVKDEPPTTRQIREKKGKDACVRQQDPFVYIINLAWLLMASGECLDFGVTDGASGSMKRVNLLWLRVLFILFFFFFKAPNSCRTVMSAAVWRRPRSKRREAFITDYNNVSV